MPKPHTIKIIISACIICFTSIFNLKVLRAGIFDSIELKKCKNEKIAIELKYKYCFRGKVKTERKLRSLMRQYQNERSNLLTEIRGLNRKIEVLKMRVANLKKKNKEDNSIASNRIGELKKTISILKKKSSDKEKKLLNENRALEKRYEGELKKIKQRLENERESYIQKFQSIKKKYEDRITKHLNTIKNLNNELIVLKKLTKDQKDELERLASQEKELQKKLEMEIKQGKIRLKKFHNKLIINIDNKISFSSGSIKLKRGILQALRKIAKILGKYPENRIIVEGHTDNVPMRTKKFRDNWQLSTERALAVLRYILKINKRLDRSRFAAAGYSKYQPIVPNNSRKNRSLNRRVDIIVIPRVPTK
ncbi:OmpA family protein [Spirochaetota bacterium]